MMPVFKNNARVLFYIIQEPSFIYFKSPLLCRVCVEIGSQTCVKSSGIFSGRLATSCFDVGGGINL